MSEYDLAGEIVDGIHSVVRDAHLSLVESPLSSPGIPDVDFCINGIEGHIELKFSRRQDCPHIRPSQVKWFKARCKAGGNPWLFTKIDRQGCAPLYLLHAGQVVYKIATSKDMTFWLEQSWAFWSLDVAGAEMRWAEFIQIITEEKPNEN